MFSNLHIKLTMSLQIRSKYILGLFKSARVLFLTLHAFLRREVPKLKRLKHTRSTLCVFIVAKMYIYTFVFWSV
jgi:hypothetical protein